MTNMTYKLVDTFTNKVLGVYETEAEARKFEQRQVHEPNQARYEIVAPKPKTVKKQPAVTEKADGQKESN